MNDSRDDESDSKQEREQDASADSATEENKSSDSNEDQADNGAKSDITGVLDSSVDEAQDNSDGQEMNVGDVLDAIENRGFGPLILIPAIISASPAGAIPGMSMIIGGLIFLIALQMLFRADHPWVPQRLEKFSFRRKRLEQGIESIRPWIRRVDRLVSTRLELLAVGPMHYVLAIVVMVLALTYFPLAFVPWAVFIPSCANILLAIGLTARDGVFVILGLIVSAGAIAVMVMYWPF